MVYDEENSVDVKVVNKNVSTAKRLWKQTKKVSFYNDEISRLENSLFVDDIELSNLVNQRQKDEARIVEYVENKLQNHRNEKGITIVKDLDEDIKYVLKGVLEELTGFDGLTAYKPNKSNSKFIIDTGFIISEVERILERLE